MSTFYAQTLDLHSLETLHVFCEEFSDEIEVMSDTCLKFEVDTHERLRIYLNFDVFQADSAIKVWMIEGPNLDEIMNPALECALNLNISKIMTLNEVFIRVYHHDQSVLTQSIKKLFKSVPDEMLKTADMYILSQMNAQLAAHELYLHRNTFNYRMKKFYDRTLLDLRDPNMAAFYQNSRSLLDY